MGAGPWNKAITHKCTTSGTFMNFSSLSVSFVDPLQGTGTNTSLNPRPLPDSTSQLWRKMLQDKIWEWPENEAKFLQHHVVVCLKKPKRCTQSHNSYKWSPFPPIHAGLLTERRNLLQQCCTSRCPRRYGG